MRDRQNGVDKTKQVEYLHDVISMTKNSNNDFTVSSLKKPRISNHES